MHISSNVSPSNLSHGVAPISAKLGASVDRLVERRARAGELLVVEGDGAVLVA